MADDQIVNANDISGSTLNANSMMVKTNTVTGETNIQGGNVTVYGLGDIKEVDAANVNVSGSLKKKNSEVATVDEMETKVIEEVKAYSAAGVVEAGNTFPTSGGTVYDALTDSLKLQPSRIINDNFILRQNSIHDFTATDNGLYYITGYPEDNTDILARGFKVYLNDTLMFVQGISSSYAGYLPAISLPLRKNDKISIKRENSESTYNFTNVFIPTVS